MSSQSRRVAVIDDHRLFAQALSMALEAEGHEIVDVPLNGESGSPPNLARRILRARPWMVFLDLNLGSQGDGGRLINELSAAGIVVVVLTGSSDRARWGECLSQGALTVISKGAELDEALAVTRRIANGLPVMAAKDRELLLEEWRVRLESNGEVQARLDSLTRREAEVLSMLMDGKQVVDISREQYVSESTVRTQVKSILAKLQVNSQLTAVGLAHKARWRLAHASTTLPSTYH